MSKPTTRPWSAQELAALRALYPHQASAVLAKALGRTAGSVYQKAALLGIQKDRAFLASQVSDRFKRERPPAMVAHQFRPGQAAWNKGTKGVMPKPAPGKGFQPGHAPHTWRPIGSERRDKDGRLLRKVSDTRIRRADWQPVRNIVWRAHFGEIPAGMFVICKDRNPNNLGPGNLALVNRATNMRLNSFHTRYPELAGLYQLKGAINRQLKRITQGRKP